MDLPELRRLLSQTDPVTELDEQVRDDGSTRFVLRGPRGEVASVLDRRSRSARANARCLFALLRHGGALLDTIEQQAAEIARLESFAAESDDPSAACLLLIRPDGLVLGVSRKDDPTAWGLPGGKIERGESALAAAGRELAEETGLTGIDWTTVSLVYSAPCGGGVTLTYMATDWVGEPRQTEQGRVEWVKWDVLFRGPFGEYNRGLYEAYEQRRRPR